jgi:hypothetical protein
MKHSNQRLVVRRRPSGTPLRLAASMLNSLPLIKHCLPFTIQTVHVPLILKAVGFKMEEFSTRNNKVYTLLRITY